MSPVVMYGADFLICAQASAFWGKYLAKNTKFLPHTKSAALHGSVTSEMI